MPLFSDDILDSPDSALLKAPSSSYGFGIDAPVPAQNAGLGLGDRSINLEASPYPAPVEDRSAGSVTPRQRTQDDRTSFEKLQDIVHLLNGGGGPPPSAYRKNREIEERKLQLDEFDKKRGFIDNGLKLIAGSEGEERDRLANDYGNALNKISPELGAVFGTLAKKPDFAKRLMSQFSGSKTALNTLRADLSGDLLIKSLQNEGFRKQIETETALSELNGVPSQKIKGMFVILPNFPELQQRYMQDKTITESELLQFNDLLKNNSNPDFQKLALNDSETSLISEHGGAFLPKFGILPASSERAVMEKRLEQKPNLQPGDLTEIPSGRKTLKVAYDPEGTLFPDNPRDPSGKFAILGEGTKEGGTNININTAAEKAAVVEKAKLDAKQVDQLREKYIEARKMAPVLDRMEKSAREDKTYSGRFADWATDLGNIAVSLNLADKETIGKVASSEQYAGDVAELIRGKIKALGSGAAISNTDLLFTQKSMPELIKTKEGRLAIIKAMRDDLNLIKKDYESADDYFSEKNTLRGFKFPSESPARDADKRPPPSKNNIDNLLKKYGSK